MSQCFRHLVIVLPCHSLEDFPIHHRDRAAANLLTCWTGLWHPALLHDAQRLPVYHPASFTVPDWLRGTDSDENQVSESEFADHPGSLVVIPEVAQTLVESEFLIQLGTEAVIIENLTDRDSLVNQAIANSPALQESCRRIDPELAQDFMALGYAFLQIQLMTRQLRYSSNLDEPEFARRVLAAAEAASQTDVDAAKDRLFDAYDLLLEEKNAYYPVEPQLLDLSLVANSTINKLPEQLSQSHAQSFHLPGELADQIKLISPETSELIRQRVADDSLSIVGGLQLELPAQLMSTESIVGQLQTGCAAIEQAFGKRPTVFVRRTFGLHPALPNLLRHNGFVGAIHATFDGGVFPRSPNGVMRWTGDDDENILTLADTPMDASDPHCFVGLGIKLGEMIDSAHMASALLVHWPGQTCQAFEDLKRIAGYTSLLGNFLTLDQFFESAYDPGFGDQFAADEYRSPYLKQAIARQQHNPVSRWVNYWHQQFQLQAIQHRALQTVTAQPAAISETEIKRWQQLAAQCQQAIDAAVVSESGQQSESAELLNKLQEVAKVWSNPEIQNDQPSDGSSLTRSQAAVWPNRLQSSSQPAPSVEAIRLVNSTPARQRLLLTQQPGKKNGSLKNQPPIWLANQDATGSEWVVELPAFGSASISQANLQPKFLFERDPPIAEELRLQNEYFFVEVDSATGGLRNIGLHGQRVSLLGQQLGVRIPSPGNDRKQPARYSKMVCRQTKTINQQKLSASIQTCGDLVDGEQVVASFQQTISVARAISRIQFEIELDLKQDLKPDLNHYVCSRFAWKDESAKIAANSIDGRQPVITQWFHGTQFISIGDSPAISLLTQGLPYHRRANRRMLDSLLVCHGESQRRFQFAIDVDQRYGLAANKDSVSPPLLQASMEAITNPASQWWFHLNCKNVTVTNCQPVFDNEQSGMMLRLKETEGRTAKLVLRSRCGLSSASRVDFGGAVLQQLEIESEVTDKVEMTLPPFSFLQLKLQFKS